MQIVAIGGSGSIGTKVREHSSTGGADEDSLHHLFGVNTITGEGLTEGACWSQVVVDVTNVLLRGRTRQSGFFERRTRPCSPTAAAVTAEGITLLLSVVGTDCFLQLGYFRAKTARRKPDQGASRVPIHRFCDPVLRVRLGDGIAESSTDGTVPSLICPDQPIASDDVAAALADVAINVPANGMIELAGLKDTPRTVTRPPILSASTRCQVVTDVDAPPMTA